MEAYPSTSRRPGGSRPPPEYGMAELRINTKINEINVEGSSSKCSCRKSGESCFSVNFLTAPNTRIPTIVGPTPSPKTSNITYPKRRYSTTRRDSLEQMETPVFSNNEVRLRKETPSSASTVLIMAGLFVCGITMLLSGMLVLLCQTELYFILAGLALLGTGISMLLACAMLQRKNIVKFVLDLNHDFYFLRMSDHIMWKLIFERGNDESSSVNEFNQLGLNSSYMK